MRVVVVDPSRTVLKAVSRMLAHDGHDVSTFTDGPDAIAFLKANPNVSALISSAELTTMSGVELCWETRLLSGTDRAIYIILMSSNSDQKHLINALDSGADEFIGKPPAEEELYARLRSAERLVRMQRELIRLAMVDPLTGLYNRRAFFEKVQQVMARASGANPPSAIMFDVDHFKKINDTYGHDAGDQVLRTLGRVAASDQMIVARLGGEEFAILHEASNLAVGLEIAEELRTKIAALAIETPQGKLTLTSSFGVSEWAPGESIDECLKRADSALYEAKTSGRNRVVAAPSPPADGKAARGSGIVRSGIRAGVAGSEAQPRSPAPSELAATQPPLPATAYVLDDEAEIGALLGKVLGACGIESRQFTESEPFLAELESKPPDLIVLDLSLGQSDAVEIIRHLEILKYRGKVLLISGRDEATLSEIAQIGERHGLAMLAPLRKPFRPADLRQRLAIAPVEARPSTGAPHVIAKTPEPPRVALIEALRNKWLEVWYQPKVDLKSLSVCGAEALMRARHPTLGVIGPASFLPPAGDAVYEPLSKLVIEHATRDWGRFVEQGLRLRLAVNVPISVIHTPGFITMVRSLLPADPTFPGLTVEITEDEVIRDPQLAREIATQLKLYNVGISIDDFGSAYASLSRLNDLPVIEVKIDRSFVYGCASDRLKHGLCQTVVDLAHRFGASACAEGVETADDLRALIKMQCDTAQGFLFAEPMPAATFAGTLMARSGKSMQALLEKSSGERQWLAQIA
jgi:two-component system cell cycle response regulator